MKMVKRLLFCFVWLFNIAVHAQIQQLGNTQFSNNLGTVKGIQITAGGSSNAVSNFIIDPAGNADLKASNFISLQPGFAVKSGATFSAKVNLNFNVNNIKIPREVLEGYLNRSLEFCIADIDATTWNDNIRMLQNIRPKLLIMMAVLWGSGWDDNGHFARAQSIAQRIHIEVDEEIICQAMIAEVIGNKINLVDCDYSDGQSNNYGGIIIPQYILDAFPDGTDNIPRPFDFLNMIYPDRRSYYHKVTGTNPYNSNPNCYYRLNDPNAPDEVIEPVDITQRETQMWYYYRATRYLDRGYESIWFGQSQLVDNNDVPPYTTIPHVNYWNLLQKIRSYASTKNRGIVICGGDGDPSSFYYGNAGSNGQLLFDYHRSPHRPQELKDGSGNYIYRKDYIDKYCGGITCIYNQILPGITPSSETVTNQNYLVDFDWYGIPGTPGSPDNNQYSSWGWDESGWWGLFDGPPPPGTTIVNSDGGTYRNQYLSYMYNQVRCFGSSGFACMPGLIPIIGTNSSFPCPVYAYSNYGQCSYYASKNHYTPQSQNAFNQEDQIRNIFNFNSYQLSCGSGVLAPPRMGVQDVLISKALEQEENSIIYPNPNSGIFNINIKDSREQNIEELSILNSLGQQVFFKNNFENDLACIEVSIKDQPNGLYFVKIKSNNKTTSAKIILLK